MIEASDQRMAYMRLTEQEAALISLNQSDSPFSVPIPRNLGHYSPEGAILVAGDQLPQTLDISDAPWQHFNHTHPTPPHSLQVLLLRPEPENNLQALADHVTVPHSITMTLSNVPAQAEDEVFIMGSGITLGNWKLDQGISMEFHQGQWQTQFPLSSGTTIAYDFAIRRANGEIIWEAGSSQINESKKNKRHYLTLQGPLTLQDPWEKSVFTRWGEF